MMTNYKMKVMPNAESEDRTIFRTNRTDDDFVFMLGEGKINYLCYTCGKILCKNINQGQVKDIVFLCPKCNTYNEIKGT